MKEDLKPMWDFFLKRLWVQKASLIPSIIFAGFFAGSQAMIAKLGGAFTNVAFIRRAWEETEIQRLCLFLILLMLVMAVSEFFHKYLVRKSLELMIQRLRNEIFGKYLSFSESVKSKFNTGTAIHHLISDINLINESRNLITELVKEPLTIAVLLGTLFSINWKLCLVCFAAIIPIALINNILGKSARRNQNKAQQKLAEIVAHTNENFQGMRTVHSLLMEKTVNAEFQNLMQILTTKQLKLTKLEESVSPMIKIFSILAGVLIFYVGAQFAFVGNSMSGGDLGSFIIAAGLLPTPLRNISNAGVHMQRISAGAKRIFDLFNVSFDALSKDQKTLLDHDKIYDVPRAPIPLEFKNVCFSYPGAENDKKAIHNLSLILEPGKKIALVGRSGAGKSTLALLSMRFIDPISGSITLGNVDAKEWELGEFRSYFSYVSQEVYFFQASIRENLSRAAPTATEKDIWEALELAQIKDRILLLPEKLNAPLNEKASNLSGGEKQRLAIARAILRAAPILVLDEATSNLDSENEHLIQKGLTNLIRDKSTLIIAHRLSTVMNCDEVIVMDKGEIVERGSPQELRSKTSHFSKMWEIQRGEIS
ncbi:MAG: ABC transporter ATP-binding protein [Bdellovibrionota bacterium]